MSNGILDLKLAYKSQSKKELFLSLFRKRRELEPCRLFHRWRLIDPWKIDGFNSVDSYYECVDCHDRKCLSVIWHGRSREDFITKDITTDIIDDYRKYRSGQLYYNVEEYYSVAWLMHKV